VCPTARCGESRGQGHPPTGWVRVFVAQPDGVRRPARWYCSTLCVVNDLAAQARQEAAERPLPEPTLTQALAYLTLTRMNATPRRVQRMADWIEAQWETVDEGLAVVEQQRLAAAYSVAMTWAVEQEARDRLGDEPEESDLLAALGA
jgi:hypothetical protein